MWASPVRPCPWECLWAVLGEALPAMAWLSLCHGWAANFDGPSYAILHTYRILWLHSTHSPSVLIDQNKVRHG